MASVSSALTILLEWLLIGFADIVKLIRDGKRTTEQLEPLKTAVQAVINGKEFQVVFPEVSSSPALDDAAAQLVAWQKLYQDQFGLTCDFSSLVIPKRRKGFGRLIVVAQGITNEQVFQQCKKHFPCWKYTDRDLDVAVPTNDRTPKNGAYAIWVRDTVEADVVHKNRSANYLKKQRISGITLLERLLLELKYFLETGKHLDIQNWTLCSGSRRDGGGVPRVRWRGGGLRVAWC